MRDNFGREINYMRISVTDRCNLRCIYCMPEEGIRMLPMADILSYEEIVRICSEAAKLGITKLRITGGESLVRKGVPKLIGMLNGISGIEEVNMTTNGILLKEMLPELLENGLHSVNVSLDTLNREKFAETTRRDEFDRVIEGIDAAIGAGLKVKINTVVHDKESFKSMVRLAEDRPIDVRFIELMPIGMGKSFKGASNDEVLLYLKSKYPDIAMDTGDCVHGNGPAVYYRIPGFMGSIGFISPIHGRFCNECNRIRLTSTGKIKPCLCYGDMVDLRPALKGDDRRSLSELLKKAITEKPGAHCFDSMDKISEIRPMVSIGG